MCLLQAGGEPRAVGVEFTRSAQGPRFCARARREVVLRCVFYYPSAIPKAILITAIVRELYIHLN
jgi:hypothetical protein